MGPPAISRDFRVLLLLLFRGFGASDPWARDLPAWVWDVRFRVEGLRGLRRLAAGSGASGVSGV